MKSKLEQVPQAAIIGVALLLILGVVFLIAGGDDKRTLTASFERTVSVYEGSDVRVLGVKVGKVEEITPSGTTVEVKISYDADQKLPDDVRAVVITPAVVGDRFIQLAPVYTGGPELADGATLTQAQTEVPLELDEIFGNIDDLTRALGPEGANANGALSRLVNVTARNFGGQGERFNQTIQDLTKLTGTLDNNKEELFGAAKEIERFVGALAQNDQTVRNFNDSLAAASDVLADERDDLRAALKNLSIALRDVGQFVRDNRGSLKRNIDGLVVVTNVLVKQRAALDEVLKTAPQALDNLFHTYNPSTGTLDTRANLGDNLGNLIGNPLEVVCGLLPPEISGGLPTCAARPGALDALKGERATVVVEPIDRSFAGLLEVK